jgi:hypothetical protein
VGPFVTLTLYDIHSDENVPATQADIDALVKASTNGALMRIGLRHLVARAKDAGADVPPGDIEALLASVEAAPA